MLRHRHEHKPTSRSRRNGPVVPSSLAINIRSLNKRCSVVTSWLSCATTNLLLCVSSPFNPFSQHHSIILLCIDTPLLTAYFVKSYQDSSPLNLAQAYPSTATFRRQHEVLRCTCSFIHHHHHCHPSSSSWSSLIIWPAKWCLSSDSQPCCSHHHACFCSGKTSAAEVHHLGRGRLSPSWTRP